MLNNNKYRITNAILREVNVYLTRIFYHLNQYFKYAMYSAEMGWNVNKKWQQQIIIDCACTKAFCFYEFVGIVINKWYFYIVRSFVAKKKTPRIRLKWATTQNNVHLQTDSALYSDIDVNNYRNGWITMYALPIIV